MATINYLACGQPDQQNQETSVGARSFQPYGKWVSHRTEKKERKKEVKTTGTFQYQGWTKNT